MLVQDDPEWHRVETRDDAAVELRSPGIDRDSVALRRVADRFGAGIEHQPQHSAGVVRRAADDEVLRRISPDLREPLEVRLEAARGKDHRASTDLHVATSHANRRGLEPSIANRQADHVGVIDDTDAEPLGRGVGAVHQRLSASQEERVGPPEVQRAPERGLKANAEAAHSPRRVRRRANHHSSKRDIGDAARDAQDVRHEFVFGIRVGEDVGRRGVHAPQVPHVPAVAAAKRARRPLEHDDARAPLGRDERGAQGSVPAAQDGDIVRLSAQYAERSARR